MEKLPDTAIAKVVKTFGNNGEVILRLYDVFPEKPDFEEPLFVFIDGLAVPLFLSSFQRRGSERALAVFDDLETEGRASELVGMELFAYGEETDEDELYYEDLAGFVLQDAVSGRQGVVREFLDYDNNPLFAVDFDGTEVMVPAADELVREIDEERRTVTVALPAGLLDLYLHP